MKRLSVANSSSIKGVLLLELLFETVFKHDNPEFNDNLQWIWTCWRLVSKRTKRFTEKQVFPVIFSKKEIALPYLGVMEKRAFMTFGSSIELKYSKSDFDKLQTIVIDITKLDKKEVLFHMVYVKAKSYLENILLPVSYGDLELVLNAKIDMNGVENPFGIKFKIKPQKVPPLPPSS